MTDVIVSNNLTIVEPTAAMWQWTKCNLTLDNPDYISRARMGKWVGNTSQYLYLYQQIGHKLVIPFGCIQEFHKVFSNQVRYSVQFAPKHDAKYASNINLYDYQKNVVEVALGRKNGIIVMPCGSGKTQTAIEIVARLGGSVLWLTHTQDLLTQSKLRAESVLETDSTFGMITGGKINIGTGITFATVQTMCQLNLADYKDMWDVIIVDECQHCCGSPMRVTQFYKVVNSLSARYKFGLTATPRRADGLHESMFALLGGIVHEVSREEVAKYTCPIQVLPVKTGYVPDYDAVLSGDGTLDYNALTTDLTENTERFQTVLDCVNQLGSSVLVLGSRVEYLQRLNDEFNGRSVCLSGMGQSKKAKSERKEILRKFNNGELDAVFASYQLAAEGLDVPNLRYVVLATPIKDPTQVQQSTGRVGRKSDKKTMGTVIDFVDDFGMYDRWYKKRLLLYKKLGYDII